MTRIIVADHVGIAAQAFTIAVIAAGRSMVIGTGTITMLINEPAVQAFTFPAPVDLSPPRNSGRRVAQWKTERKGWRP